MRNGQEINSSERQMDNILFIYISYVKKIIYLLNNYFY